MKLLKDCMPINLCNFSYKFIANILVSRIKKLLPKVIAEEHGAFASGRSIFDIGVRNSLLYIILGKMWVAYES